jgi:3-hydroxyacyl-[acyl-carrier-protein] dehydratase
VAPPGSPKAPVLPATILTEAIAQVGAILILSKPENREKLIFFMGIDASATAARSPGDVVEIEAIVKRLRSRMGVLSGAARVNGKVVCDGTMTFALGPRTTDASNTPSQQCERRGTSDEARAKSRA